MSLPKFFLSGVRRVPPVLLLGSIAVSLSAWAGPKQVPFKARITAQEALSFPPNRCPFPGLLGSTTGKGTASHMGAVKMVATDCPVLAPGLPPTFSDGQLILTAANGDELHGTYEGYLAPLDPVAGTFSVVGILTIKPTGTGRFKNASGSNLTLGGTITLAGLVAYAEYEVAGTLSYPKD